MMLTPDPAPCPECGFVRSPAADRWIERQRAEGWSYRTALYALTRLCLPWEYRGAPEPQHPREEMRDWADDAWIEGSWGPDHLAREIAGAR